MIDPQEVINLLAPRPQQGAGPMAAVIPLQQQGQPEELEEQELESGCDAGQLAGALIAMAAYAKELQTQAHLVHLNYECSNFLSVHTFLKGQYEAHLEQFDKLSELVRSMDYLMPLCSCGLSEAMSCDFEHVQAREPKAMLIPYYRNLEAFAMAAKELERLAQEAKAPDVANYAAELVGDCFKGSWFIKASLRGS